MTLFSLLNMFVSEQWGRYGQSAVIQLKCGKSRLIEKEHGMIGRLILTTRYVTGNLDFRNSFDWNFEAHANEEAATLGASIAGILATSMLNTSHVVVDQTWYNMSYVDGKWKQSQAVFQQELSVTGMLTPTTGELLPYGCGLYFKQSDGLGTGRPGKLLIKGQLTEGDVYRLGNNWSLVYNPWKTIRIPTFLDNLVGLGKHFASGAADKKLTNLHKGVSEPQVITGMTFRWVNKYRSPRPVLV